MRKWQEIVQWGIVLIGFVIGAAIYPKLPQMVASHWNIYGQVNGYVSQFWGAFLLPLIILGMVILMKFFPNIDPKQKNIESFYDTYAGFIIFIEVFLLAIYIYTIFFTFGVQINLGKYMAILFTGLLFYLGVLIAKAKQNWFIGIRTPWTLSSERVWDKTHALGGKLYKVCAIIALLGFFLPQYSFYFVFGTLVCSSIFLLIYSYMIFKKETK